MVRDLVVEPGAGVWSGDPLYWQLVYLDHTETEGPGNASIRLAGAGARELRLVKPDLTPVVRVDLWPQERRGAKPIFYRRRWLEHSDGLRRTGLGITVFGRGWDGDTRVDTELWAALNGRIVDCPQGAIDPVTIRLQIEG